MSEPAEELRSFEEIYRSVGGDLDKLPWAGLEPHPDLVRWLDDNDIHEGRALVIGCGLGDDADELARRGLDVTAFDLSPTAIDWARRRFSDSGRIAFQVADLLELPGAWTAAFDLVVEIHTIQSMPRSLRPQVVEAIASTVTPGGRLFVRCFVTDEPSRAYDRPWPLTADDLALITEQGLRQVESARSFAGDRDWLVATYQK